MRNPRWEQALIGTVLANPLDAQTVSDVSPQDMMYAAHQAIWTLVLELERAGRLSYQAVVEKLHDIGLMDNLGADVGDGELIGELYLNELLSRRSSPSVREYADNVINAAVKRDLHNLAHIWALDSESAKEADELLDAVEEQIYALRRNRVDAGESIATLIDEYSQIIDNWRADRIVPAFTFTTPYLGSLIPFLEPTDFMLIAGRPGMGKSSLLRAEAFQAARNGRKVVVFNLENNKIEYVRYLVASVTGIDTWKLRQPKLLTNPELAQVKAVLAELKTIPLQIVSLGAPTVYEVIRIARKLVAQGYEVIMVDYIQLIKNGIENENQDISMSSSLLRGFSLKYGVPVIAAAQLNRDQTKRADGSDAQLSDLRGSGSLEQDAVIVAFTGAVNTSEEELRRIPENRNPDGSFTIRAIYTREHVAKNRNGPVDKTPIIKWDKSTNRFYAMSAQQEPGH